MVVISKGVTLITLLGRFLTIIYPAFLSRAGVLFTAPTDLDRTRNSSGVRNSLNYCGPMGSEGTIIHIMGKSFSAPTDSTKTFIRRMLQ